MPRDGSGVYTQPFPDVVAGTTIESAVYNGNVNDVEQDLNTPRPVVAGGTGGTDVNSALDNLSAEKYKQVVTNWDTNVWRAGSFYAATAATGSAPIPTHAFAGIVYYANATDFVIEAIDLTAAGKTIYTRIQTAGAWGSWLSSTPGTAKTSYIINGAMMVSQENGTTAGTGTPYYPVDMFYYTGSGSTAVVAVSQVVVGTPGGSPNRLRVSVTTGDVTQDAADARHIVHVIEGLRSADLYVNGPRTITLQFGVKAPAGTYCVAVRNGAGTRAYVAEYTITAAEANTDVVKSATLVTDTGGSWTFDNTAGIVIVWSLICGSNFRTTPGIWTSGNFLASANQFNFMALSGNVFELFDVSLTEGNTAPSFKVPDYVNELMLCRRYWQLSPSAIGQFIAASTFAATLTFVPPMRASPTLTTKVAASVSEYGVNTYTIGAIGSVLAGPASYWFSAPSSPAAVATRIGNISEGAITVSARL